MATGSTVPSSPRWEGLEQLDAYLAGLDLLEGWLIIFDRRPEALPLPQRTQAERARSPQGREVVVIRA